MADNQKTNNVTRDSALQSTGGYVRKRWFTDGSSMAHSGTSRIVGWLINLLLYVMLNMYYLRIQTGHLWQFGGSYESGLLIRQLLSPLNIFQFPMQIVVIGMIMCLICTVPIIIAQFYNLLYAIPFALGVLLFGHNLVLCLCLLASCAAVSFEPLRFKSKFVAAVMCLLPEVLYWWLYSGPGSEQNVLRWAMLYSPWALAFIFSIVLFAIVITIGHFLQYRPGILAPIFGILLALTVVLFSSHIGMNERDFRAQVCRYSPDQVPAFQDRTIVDSLEKDLANRLKKEQYLNPETIMAQLKLDWRWTFSYPLSQTNPDSSAAQELLKIENARVDSINHINDFIREHPDNERQADALYYKALLIDVKVDIRSLCDQSTLRFYHDIPSDHSESIWREILSRFDQTVFSIEARWRIARLLAGRESQTPGIYNYKESLALLKKALRMSIEAIHQRQRTPEKNGAWANRLGAIFTSPQPSIDDLALAELRLRIEKLIMLINTENRTGHLSHERRLAEFVRLDRHQLGYEDKLNELMLKSPKPDPLQDNIELAQANLIDDPAEKIIRLADLADRYPDRDGGMEATIQLAHLLTDRRTAENQPADLREKTLSRLKQIIDKQKNNPDLFYARYAKEILK